MADEHDRRKQIENLVSQDPDINDTKMRDFRMQLETTLAEFERRGMRLRRIAIRATLAYSAIAALLIVFRPPGGASLVAGVLAVVATAAMIVGGYAIITYFGQLAPAIRRLQFDSHTAMIAELQQQVVALRDELRTRPPGGDTRSS